MLSFIERSLGKLALALVTVGLIGLTSLSPAKAWYDAYGYWHPGYGYYSGCGYYNYEQCRRWAYWRHHRWCEYHPDQCYFRPYYGYGY
jgi:hypothetical protein